MSAIPERGAPAPASGADRYAAFALIYTAAVLTLTEYFFIPGHAARSGLPAKLPPMPPDLAAGLVWAGSTYVFFLALPALFVLVRREKFADYGWSTRGLGRHLLVYAALYAAMAPLAALAANRTDFAATYPFVRSVRGDSARFWIWETAYLLQFLALEAFFRGWLLFTLARRFGSVAAVAAMVVPYTMIHFHKPFPECAGAIVAGLVLGTLALRYRSFLGGVILHAGVAFTMDFLAVRRA
jgi:uncharacterized protein